MHFKIIIFDYDGVIADSFPLRYEIFKKICPAVGRPCPPSAEALKRIYGNNAVETFKTMGFTPEEIEIGTQMFKRELDNSSPKLFQGISDVLQKLSETHKLILITANKESIVRAQLEETGVAKHFIIISGNESIFNSYNGKKHEKIITLLKQLDALPDETLFIADRDVDRHDALSAGIPDDHIILTDYGYGHTKKQKWRVDKPEDLLRVIEILEK